MNFMLPKTNKSSLSKSNLPQLDENISEVHSQSGLMPMKNRIDFSQHDFNQNADIIDLSPRSNKSSDSITDHHLIEAKSFPKINIVQQPALN